MLHTWGQALTRHPAANAWHLSGHVHCVVPGGGLSPGGTSWTAGRANVFLAVKPLAMLFRRLFLERLKAACKAGTCSSELVECGLTRWAAGTMRPFWQTFR